MIYRSLMGKRVWAEIDLAAIRHNIGEIRGLVGPRVAIMPVVKANAYGHGLPEITRSAVSAGIDWLGVATVSEGLAVREQFPHVNILDLTPPQSDEAEAIILHGLTSMIGTVEAARVLAQTAQRLRAGAKVHLDVDTGMGRSGVLPHQAGHLARLVGMMPSIDLIGIASHFASADLDPVATARQLASFQEARESVEAEGARLLFYHTANSAALLQFPATRLNLVRTGLSIYGLMPRLQAGTALPPLQPALTLKTRIALIRDLPAGHPISYHSTHRLERPSRVATLPVGYGDGYPRALSGVGGVLVAGRRAPILGRVCMDMTVVDVTDLPEAREGSEVVLIGAQGDARISAEEIATAIDTTVHDITTRLSARVERVYLHENPPNSGVGR